MLSFPNSPTSRIGLNILLLLAGVVALRLAESVILPMLIALLLASVLGPGALWLYQTLKIRWRISCAVVLFGLVLLNVLITVAFSLTISRLVQQLPNPNNEEQMLDTWRKFRSRITELVPPDTELDPVLFPKDPKNASEIRAFQILSEKAPSIVLDITRYTGDWIWQCILIFFILLFVLFEGRVLSRRISEIFGPTSEMQAKAIEVLSDMAKQVRTYLVWRTIINFGLAIVLGLIYQLAGLKQGWTWAILLAILNYIPYLGPFLAGAPPILDAFFTGGAPTAVVILVVYVVVIVVEGWLVVPLLMGRSMDLNATTVMLACLFWPLVWGPTGMFLAMPIMAGIKAVMLHIPELRPWGILMSSVEDEDEPPRGLLLPGDSTNGKAGGGHGDGPVLRSEVGPSSGN
jgi:predicted PurR-regulated permease PerM